MRDGPGSMFALGLITVVLIRLAYRRRWSLPACRVVYVFGLAFVAAVASWMAARFPLWMIGAAAVPAVVLVELAAGSRRAAEDRRRSRQDGDTMILPSPDTPFVVWRVLAGLLGWLADVVLGRRRGMMWLVSVYYQAAAAFGAIGLAVLLDHFVDLDWRGVFVELIDFWDRYIRATVTWVSHILIEVPFGWLGWRVEVPVVVGDYLTTGTVVALTLHRAMHDYWRTVAQGLVRGRDAFLNLRLRNVRYLVMFTLLYIMIWPLLILFYVLQLIRYADRARDWGAAVRRRAALGLAPVWDLIAILAINHAFFTPARPGLTPIWPGVHEVVRNSVWPTVAVGLFTVVLILVTRRYRLTFVTPLVLGSSGLALVAAAGIWATDTYPLWIVVTTAAGTLVLVERAWGRRSTTAVLGAVVGVVLGHGVRGARIRHGAGTTEATRGQQAAGRPVLDADPVGE